MDGSYLHAIQRQNHGHDLTRWKTWTLGKFDLFIHYWGLLYSNSNRQVHVPLESTDPSLADRRYTSFGDEDADLLPMPHLTATTILGGRAHNADTIGELYATQIASAIAVKNPEEKRLLVLGMGMTKVETDGQTYMEVLQLVLECV